MSPKKKLTINDIGEMLEHVVKSMADLATKDDVAAITRTQEDHTKTLNDHTRDLNIIKNDLTTNLDRRLQLEVRVDKIEKHVGIGKKIAT